MVFFQIAAAILVLLYLIVSFVLVIAFFPISLPILGLLLIAIPLELLCSRMPIAFKLLDAWGKFPDWVLKTSKLDKPIIEWMKKNFSFKKSS